MRPGGKNGVPARGKVFNQPAAHRMGKEKNSTRLLIKGILKGWGPERGTRKERNDPLRLQSRNLSHRRKEVDTTLKAGRRPINIDGARPACEFQTMDQPSLVKHLVCWLALDGEERWHLYHKCPDSLEVVSKQRP